MRGLLSPRGQRAVAAVPVIIGNGEGGLGWHPLKGAINELAVFPRALSPKEIQTLYDMGKAGRPLLRAAPKPPQTDAGR
jgi:hypothetical protein